MWSSCPICGATGLESVFAYDEPPEGETPLPLPEGTQYRRELLRCRACGHFVNDHDLDLEAIYSGEYMDVTYEGDKLQRSYERIMSLPPDRSDNVARVGRIGAGEGRTLLDIGSGLGVFPARMKEAGWTTTALDPDPRSVEHAVSTIGVEGVCADFMTAEGLGQYDLVTLNKVLEHVVEPVAMLARAGEHLTPGGLLYVELPDGEVAVTMGAGREEFGIEHYHAFSMASICLLAVRAGLTVRSAARLREPSTKVTLYAFLEQTPGESQAESR
jgi:2-polyprenyl-3-methyl-5-hydroxy-6-metoxy-1,4-benzoquinol methylase